jgi:hypothetical protein
MMAVATDFGRALSDATPSVCVARAVRRICEKANVRISLSVCGKCRIPSGLTTLE